MYRLDQKGITMSETLACAAIVVIILMYVMSAYSSNFKFGMRNTDDYTAQMVASNQLEKAKWTVIHTKDFTPRTVDQGTIKIGNTDFNYIVQLQPVLGLGTELLYNLTCDVSWKDKSLSMKALVAQRGH